MKPPLICICEEGFYPIEAAPQGIKDADWAKSNGEINDHIIRIETVNGDMLWERVVQ